MGNKNRDGVKGLDSPSAVQFLQMFIFFLYCLLPCRMRMSFLYAA